MQIFSDKSNSDILDFNIHRFISTTDHITSVMSVKRPNIKEELRNFAVVLDKISRCRLDKAEFDYLKSTLLFRTGKYFNNALFEVFKVLLQVKSMCYLYNHT